MKKQPYEFTNLMPITDIIAIIYGIKAKGYYEIVKTVSMKLTKEGAQLLEELGFDEFIEQMELYFKYQDFEELSIYIVNWKDIF